MILSRQIPLFREIAAICCAASSQIRWHAACGRPLTTSVIWTFPSVRANDDHEAKFPLELPRRIIQLLTRPGDVVLDCFVGSGTTAVAAILEGRRYIGIDISEKYVEMSRKACARAIESLNGAKQPKLL